MKTYDPAIGRIVNQISGDPELKGLLEGEGREDGLIEYLQQSYCNNSNKPSAPATVSDMVEVREWYKPIALLTKKGNLCGTAFFAAVDGTTVLFGAGHCLSEDDYKDLADGKVIRNQKITKDMELDHYKLNFGDLDGRRTAGGVTIQQLTEAFQTTLVVQLDATTQKGHMGPPPDKRFKPEHKESYRNPRGNNRVKNNTDESEEGSRRDFFYLILHKESPGAHVDFRKKLLKEKIKNIGTLRVGDEKNYLRPDRGAPLLVIGHPAERADQDAPLRIDNGPEVVADNDRKCGVTDEALRNERILYDLKTFQGNSGSPVFGKGLKVKGIHVNGGGPGSGLNYNKAQIMEHIISDIKKEVQEYNEAAMQ